MRGTCSCPSARVMTAVAAAIVGVSSGVMPGVSVARADTGAFTIVDDPVLDAALALARSRTLATSPFTRLDAALLVEQPDGTWRRGSFNPDALAYPASCVKLAYLAAAMRYQADAGLAFDALDGSVGPMISVSDNVATGVVLDAITQTSTLPGVTSTAHPQWASWYEARLFAEEFLGSRGLLGGQNIVNKTYPTNSGWSPVGAESVLIAVEGGNLMSPRLSASLMLEVVGGAIEAETGLAGSTAYMRGLLAQDRWSDYSSIGFGLPPGTLLENKIGIAYDTLEDIAHFILPDGRRCILAAYSNGWVPSQPLPYDAAPLGTFAWHVLEAAGFKAGNPPEVVIDSADPAVAYAGAWSTGSAQPDKYGPSYRFASGGGGANRATFAFTPPVPGVYEVTAWWPQSGNRASNTPFTVFHAGGSTTARVDQRVWGGRWVKLGDFRFDAAGGSVVVSDDGTGTGVVLADAVRLTAWPNLCAADLTGDGEVDSGDLSVFVGAFLSGDAGVADVSGDGQVDSGDLSAFIVAFLAGC